MNLLEWCARGRLELDEPTGKVTALLLKVEDHEIEKTSLGPGFAGWFARRLQWRQHAGARNRRQRGGRQWPRDRRGGRDGWDRIYRWKDHGDWWWR